MRALPASGEVAQEKCEEKALLRMPGDEELSSEASESQVPSHSDKGGPLVEAHATEVFSQIAAECGCEIYDVESPKRHGGVLRIAISKGHPRENSAGLEECVAISKRILSVDEERKLFHDSCSLEVSTPGINRKLKTTCHYSHALGERIRVSVRGSEGVETLLGILKEANEEELRICIQDEKKSKSKSELENDALVTVQISSITKGHVDFPFE